MGLRATELIQKECLNCKNTFSCQFRELKRGRGKFCSKLCSNTFVKNRISKRIKQTKFTSEKTYRRYFGKRLEHRVVMEEMLGRKLIKGEVVHHIDGNRRNNSPDNLQLYASNAEHLRDHLKTNIGKCISPNCQNDQKRSHMCYMHYARLNRNKRTKQQEVRL